ncbi:MAG TPA: HEAT repeat domain-containing protein [Candidatus Polarisedimenticolia bacterium]|nr:HEAT repeat domain-containing protein [Candidatus Polarisedimenticolia bacterium]
MRRPVEGIAAALLAAALPGAGPPARAEVRPLTLYEKVGRAPIILVGEVTEAYARGKGQPARIRNHSTVRCSATPCPAETFLLAYKLDSFLRAPWEDRIVFAAGERVVLFLRPFTKEDGRSPHPELYTLMWGAQGKHLLPPEGEAAHREAVARLAAIAAAPLETQTAMLREALADPNPIVSDAAFDEVLRQRLGGPELIPRLIPLLSGRRESTRVQSLRLIAEGLEEAAAAGREVPGRDDLSDLLRGRAASDPSEAFRVEAVRTLAALGGAGVRAFLERLAAEDPSQRVRYEAEASLAAWSAVTGSRSP